MGPPSRRMHVDRRSGRANSVRKTRRPPPRPRRRRLDGSGGPWPSEQLWCVCVVAHELSVNTSRLCVCVNKPRRGVSLSLARSTSHTHSASVQDTSMDDAGMTAAVLDSMSLDGEIESLLVTRWQQVCGHAGERLSSRLQPELLAALRLTLLYLSWHGDDASPAQALLRLRRARQRSSAADSRGFAVGGLAPTPRPVPAKRMLIYGCLIVLVPWAWTRISQRLASRRADGAEDTTARRRRLRLMRQIEGGCACLVCRRTPIH